MCRAWGMCTLQHASGRQRTTCCGLLSPPTAWALGSNSGPQGWKQASLCTEHLSSPGFIFDTVPEVEKTLTSRVKICLVITRHCRARESDQWVKELEQTQTKSGMVAGPCNLFSYSDMGDKTGESPDTDQLTWHVQQ